MRIKTIKIAQFNLENLFLFLDFYQGQSLDRMPEFTWARMQYGPRPVKPLFKLRPLAEWVKQVSPDILLVCEVGGPASLENFNRLFLNELYHPLCLEGNSNRGIDLGFLVKKNLPYSLHLISHRNHPLSPPFAEEKFSRDVLELRLYRPHATIPSLILLNVHLKSQLDPQGLDPFGRKRRQAELSALVDIYLGLENEFSQQGSTVPFIVGGDFNGRAASPHPHPEFSDLYERTSLKDVLEIAGVPQEERITHVHFHLSGLVEYSQLDYLFLSPALHPYVFPAETFVHPFEWPRRYPQKREEQFPLPSDHYPVILTLKNAPF